MTNRLRRIYWLLVWALVLGAPLVAAASPVSKHRAMPGARFHRSSGYSVATFNIQNLYRPRPLNPRAQVVANRQPRRQNWMPENREAYQKKLSNAARTIVKKLQSPDIIALQEIENFKRSTRLGEQSVMQHLIDEIKRQTGARGAQVVYAFAKTPGVSDTRGISNGFLYRVDRVRLAANDAQDPVLGRIPRVRSRHVRAAINPKSFNTPAPSGLSEDGQGRKVMSRDVLVAKFEVFRKAVGQGKAETVYVLNNHLKSNPDLFQKRRKEQAAVNAKLVKDIHAHNSRANIIVTGDMNVDFNQQPHRQQIGPLERLTPADRNSPTVLHNLTAKLGEGHRFTYNYRNGWQLLDWMYTTGSLHNRLIDIQIPHTNTKGRDRYKSSDHDPVLARFKMTK